MMEPLAAIQLCITQLEGNIEAVEVTQKKRKISNGEAADLVRGIVEIEKMKSQIDALRVVRKLIIDDVGTCPGEIMKAMTVRC